MNHIYPLLCAFLLAGTAAGAETKIHIAVNELQAKGVEKSAASVISDRIRSEMVNTGVFRVMERGEMESILKEQGFQQSGMCTDEQCLIEVGQILGVERMLAGTIGKVGSMYTIALRVISVQTGEIMTTVNEDCQCPIEEVLSSSTRGVAQKLARKALIQSGQVLEVYGSLSVTTDPAGAAVFIDGVRKATTPARIEKVLAGKHTLKIQAENCETVEQQIEIEQDKLTNLEFNLSWTAAHIDSVKNQRRQSRGKRQLMRKILFGTIAAGAGAMGVYYNMQAERAYDTYQERNLALPQEHSDNWSAVEEAVMLRTVFYGIAGASTVALGVSFVF